MRKKPYASNVTFDIYITKASKVMLLYDEWNALFSYASVRVVHLIYAFNKCLLDKLSLCLPT